MMKTLTEFIQGSMVNESKQELKECTNAMMEKEGIGVNGNDTRNFSEHHSNDKLLMQREICKHVSFEILNNCRFDSISPFRTREETFRKTIDVLQVECNKKYKENGLWPIDLSQIKLKCCKPWLDRFSLAVYAYKQKVYDEYEEAFFKEYFDKVFA